MRAILPRSQCIQYYKNAGDAIEETLCSVLRGADNRMPHVLTEANYDLTGVADNWSFQWWIGSP